MRDTRRLHPADTLPQDARSAGHHGHPASAAATVLPQLIPLHLLHSPSHWLMAARRRAVLSICGQPPDSSNVIVM